MVQDPISKELIFSKNYFVKSMQKFFHEKTSTDVTIKVDGEPIHAHKFVLVSVCGVYAFGCEVFICNVSSKWF